MGSNRIEDQDALILNEVPNQLHCAQQDINQLRLLNVCLQSTLFRIQSQLVEYVPEDLPDQIERTVKKQKFAELRQNEDHTRQNVSPQEFSFFQMMDTVKTIFDRKSHESLHSQTPLDKHEKQVSTLYEIFHELNTMIHTQHHDRICQLYLTLAEASQSVVQARQMLDRTVEAHRRLTQKRIRQRLILLVFIVGFVSALIIIIIVSIRTR